MDPKPKTKPDDDYRDDFTEEELEDLRRLYAESKANPLTRQDIERGKQRWLELAGEGEDE